MRLYLVYQTINILFSVLIVRQCEISSSQRRAHGINFKKKYDNPMKSANTMGAQKIPHFVAKSQFTLRIQEDI